MKLRKYEGQSVGWFLKFFRMIVGFGEEMKIELIFEFINELGKQQRVDDYSGEEKEWLS